MQAPTQPYKQISTSHSFRIFHENCEKLTYALEPRVRLETVEVETTNIMIKYWHEHAYVDNCNSVATFLYTESDTTAVWSGEATKLENCIIFESEICNT